MDLQLNMLYSHKSNAIKSPLLRLPAELRNMIFGWVFYDVLYILSEYYRSHERVVYMHVDDCPGSYTPHDLGLLLVCRQIYAETALLPYSLGSFYVWAEFLGIDEQVYALHRFLKARTQEQIDAISFLEFDEFYNSSWNTKPLEGTGAFWVAKMAEESYQAMISSLIIDYPTVWTLDREMKRLAQMVAV